MKYMITNSEETVRCGFEICIKWAQRQGKQWGFETAPSVWLTANQKWWPAVNIVSLGVLFGTRMEFRGGGSLCIQNAERLSLYSEKKGKNWGQNSCSSGKFSEKSPKIWFHGSRSGLQCKTGNPRGPSCANFKCASNESILKEKGKEMRAEQLF
jgi:hypothetical protein